MNHQQLVDQVTAAFPQVVIDAKGAFETWGGTYTDGESYETRLDGQTWARLDRNYLDLRSDALGFLGTAHLTAVLPAYLCQLLEGDPFSEVQICYCSS